jgi:hypothetical protein
MKRAVVEADERQPDGQGEADHRKADAFAQGHVRRIVLAVVAAPAAATASLRGEAGRRRWGRNGPRRGTALGDHPLPNHLHAFAMLEDAKHDQCADRQPKYTEDCE